MFLKLSSGKIIIYIGIIYDIIIIKIKVFLFLFGFCCVKDCCCLYVIIGNL